MQYDVFICHASEDKDDFVRPLAEKLRQQHLEVWYDEFSLKIGDSLTQKIDEGLAVSNYGIVVLSPNFFKKPWAKRELKGLTLREMTEERDLILPIWHRVGVKEILEYSPPLADKKAGSSADGINSLIRELKNKIKPEESPLKVARDYLSKLNVDSPPISDEWWLDIVEYKEFLKYPDLNSGKRWIFPLPYGNDDHGGKKGQNIASTALQLDWSFEGEELNISPTTHPDIVHEYIHRWPGLYDCARANPHILAMYVPQLTIPGFDEGFEDVFDELLLPENKRADIIFSYGKHATIDDKVPLCGDVIAYRHPSFGNYIVEELAHWYFDAHDTSYIRSTWDIFEGLVWLLSSDSDWLPKRHRETFLKGIFKRDRWINRDYSSWHNLFARDLMRKNRKQFKYTKGVLNGLEELVTTAINKLGIVEKPNIIIEKIIDLKLVDHYYDYIEWFDSKRRK
ncbi:toll/interleukin-1 receptor domain-containing protein [Marinifilum flexuosum]|uniref:TIR domain-containing protein n=1 Tax=Marinifilum flexuosum TaxID=1117708 RepID=A0A419X8J6_9BACT|nr:toll/interleukin-1 receptor domain-containing protein [Marinifilum flexuosum]RKE04061.1 TIR domain-containing protein [Marinifilum flexuosum]